MLTYNGKLQLEWENKAYNDFASRRFEEIIKKLEPEDSVFIWGAAERGKQVIETIRSIRADSTIQSIFFLDKDEDKRKKRYMDLEVIWPLEDAWKRISLNGKNIIINTTGSLAQISNEVNKWKDKNACILNFPGSMNWQLFDHLEFDDWKYIEENKEELESFFENLSDEKSRKVLWAILNYRITKESDYIVQIYQIEGHYYEADIFGSENEWFRERAKSYVDVGTYDGDTMDLIREVTANNYKKIICIEAGLEAFKRLEKKVKTLQRVEAWNYALWSEKGTAYLESEFIGKESNRVAKGQLENNLKNKGMEKVYLAAFDELYPDQEVDYIKFDIEGAETEAIKGMKCTLQKNEPVLAISVYHRPQDILEIAKLVKQYVPSYKFYLRHYGPVTDETVLYAVSEREEQR